MLIGTVIENIWATRKENGLTGLTFLVIQPGLDQKHVSSEMPIIAVDRIGAGIGDKVIVTQGSPASIIQVDQKIPIDAIVIGIVDSPVNGT
ncbi:ethanolamine utilization protein EutN [Sporosarcina ureae]|uniref:EutN/CcmL family microcompartment protein n=1 Tax=Sporosarcina ureae TaxID=1571 RepID=UPI000A15B39A|nr:EutN/CcmL family microcompartment protein [Sporosarcina ureae]ARJ39613.1 ethanolamine utilization protein EutN [Sporosarcina ureae]